MMMLNRQRSLSLLALLAFTSSASITRADEVISKDTALRGSVTGFNSATVQLAPEYGEGTLSIKWEDVQAIETETKFQVLYGDDLAVYGPLRGYRDGVIVVGEDQEVEVASIFAGFALSNSQPSFRDRLRSRWRYWDGYFDVSFNAAQSTIDTTGLLINFNTTRTKDPTRLILGASYRFGMQKEKGRSEVTTEDEWKGLARGEYNLTARIYSFLSGDAEYDAIEQLSLRAVPKTGLGYTLWEEVVAETKKNFLRAEGGVAYIYERYFGGDESDFFALAFGAMALYHLPFDSRFEWRFDYLPAVADWANDYLIRTEAALIMPMFDPVAIKASIIDEFDNTPAANAEKNSLYVNLGFSVGW